jgi:adenylosuccinate synthase
MCKTGNVTVVLDSQAGSCGKGKFIGYLAGCDKPLMAMDNFMTNAGHTYVTDDGGKVMTQHLPTSMVNRDTMLFIGPGAAITISVLFDEILRYSVVLGSRAVFIHPRAVVIKLEHCETEKRILRSGSTFKGCGAAQADKVMRQAELFGDWWHRVVGGDLDKDGHRLTELGYTIEQANFIINHIVVTDSMFYINRKLNEGYDLLIEGSQGCDLDINYGLGYPHTTSRQCHAGQLVADCGISPLAVTDVIMIMRPYPIRISNTTNLQENGETLVTSSGDYAGSDELSWEEIRERCGAPKDIDFGEKTTVTKKTRRVFEMNWDRLEYVSMLNRPTCIALNFAQYLDWGALGCTSWKSLPCKVKDFIEQVEKVTGVEVGLIGTGARNCDIIDVRSTK